MRYPTFLLVSIFLLAGCGYGFGLRLPEGIETLEVPVFSNTTLLRGLEFELTNALSEELKSRTSAKIVSTGGDAKLSGTVTAYEKIPVYESTGIIVAGRVKVAISFKLAGKSSEKALREELLEEVQDFDTRSGIHEAEARRKAVRELARKIVYQLEAWRE